MMPHGVQRRRTEGWKKPPNTVIVDRTSIFGNPFRITIADSEQDRRIVVMLHRAWLSGDTYYPDEIRCGKKAFSRSRVLASLHLLRGKDLACTCSLPAEGAPDLCHRQTLLDLANGGTP